MKPEPTHRPLYVAMWACDKWLVVYAGRTIATISGLIIRGSSLQMICKPHKKFHRQDETLIPHTSITPQEGLESQDWSR